jgi:hypothetical protein
MNAYVMHLVLPFIIFIHMHLASHLGMLDTPREGRDVGAKSEDGVWWTYLEDGRAKHVPRWKMLAKRVSSIKH